MVLVFTLGMICSSIALASEPGEVKITWLVHDHVTQLNAWRGIIDAYEAENPNVTVELVVGPGTAGGAYDEHMALLAASGILPDVIYLASPGLIASGNILELSDLIASDPEFPALSESWVPGIWEHSAHGTERYVIPIAVAFLTTYINPQHFAEAGLVLPDDNWTWAEFVESAKRLTLEGPDGVERWGIERIQGLNLLMQPEVVPFVYQAGGRFFDNHYSPTESRFTDRNVIEGLEFIHDLRWEHHVTPRPGDPHKTFISQGASMRIHFPARIAQFADRPELPWEIRRLPQHRERATVAGYDGVSINRNTKHIDVVWDFVKFLTTPTAQRLYAPYGQIPVSSEVVLSKEWLEFPIPNRNKIALFYETEVAYNRQIRPELSEDINRIFNEEWLKAWARNEEPVQTVAAEIHRRITSLLQ